MGIYLIFGTFGKKCGVGLLTLSGALKPPVRQLRNTVKPFNLAALNFSVLPFVDILAAL